MAHLSRNADSVSRGGPTHFADIAWRLVHDLKPQPRTEQNMTTKPAAYRKKPIVVKALPWDGTNATDLYDFTGNRFAVLDDEDRANCDDQDATAQVFDVLHSTWVLVQTGDWIIRGVLGEFYPCRDSVFRETYEPAEVAA